MLIYQDCLRRRAEAAAAAASSLTRPGRTSPRLIDNDVSTKSEVKAAPKRKRRSNDHLDTEHIAQKQKGQNKSSSIGCTNQVKSRGVCMKRKLCSSAGCTNIVNNGGACKRHGAKVKLCSSAGCTNQSKKGGVCRRHGAKAEPCHIEGCTNQIQNRGVCIRHGAKVKLCSFQFSRMHKQCCERRSMFQAWRK